MFDINDIINNVITAAVTEATTGLLMRIATLESANNILHKTQHEAMTAMRDRIAALETQAAAAEAQLMAVRDRITALENNPGTPAVAIDKDALINHLNEQEWFWEKLRKFADVVVEQAMDHHLECYDHDNYDDIASKVDDLPDLDDYVTRDEVRSEIEDVLNNCSLSIRC